MREIILNVGAKEIRYAYLKFGKLQDLIIERKKSRYITGSIYRGKITNILHNIQSAFVDIGEGENCFIHISDILENTKKFEEMFDMDFDLDYDISAQYSNRKTKQDINKILKIDQTVLVQIVKGPIGTKGARLTSNISIPGRYLVLLPNTPHRGVSRKIEEKAVRDRLKKTIKSFELPKDMGLIGRTASQNATTEMLVQEATELLKIWETIVKKFHEAKGPVCLYEESDIVKKAIITAVDKKYDRIIVDDYSVYRRCYQIYTNYEKEHLLKIEFHRNKKPIFEKFDIEREIDIALRRKVWLSCGGYLYFDRTEAMHTIDVNSGKSSEAQAPRNVEEALVRINLEAAEEIARQFRLRNIGGLIICDFIDMKLKKNKKRVLERLKECMKEDYAKCTILGMSEFGLVEMTRQRSRESLAQIIFTYCPYCQGGGYIKTNETISVEIERALKKIINYLGERDLELTVHPYILNYLEKQGDKEYFSKYVQKANGKINFKTADTLHLNEFQFHSKEKKIDV